MEDMNLQYSWLKLLTDTKPGRLVCMRCHEIVYLPPINREIYESVFVAYYKCFIDYHKNCKEEDKR